MSTSSQALIEDTLAAASLARQYFESAFSQQFLGETVDSWRAQTRRALNLPTDLPLIMTGHQAGIWHAGIAEKFVVARAIADRIGGAVVHIVVDHDCNDASLISYPALVETAQGRTLTRFALDRSPRSNAPNALRKPVRLMRSDRAHEIPADIDAALTRIEAAVRAEYTQPTLALQMAHAANRLLAPRGSVDFTICASTLASTSIARAMREQFASLRNSYNEAIAGQRIAPLASDAFPFWVLDRASASRRPFMSSDLTLDRAQAACTTIAPRALTLTALARIAACDLFIHGTGGSKYDLAMESWMSDVLRVPAQRVLAPRIAATATHFAALSQFVPAREMSATPQALRALEHDPFGDNGASKRALLANICGTRAQKRTAYLAMQRALEQSRAQHAMQLTAMRLSVQANAHARAVHELAFDRTWPFPMSGPATI